VPHPTDRDRAARHDPTGLIPRIRAAALYALGALTVLADAGAFAESANGVFRWGVARGMPLWRALLLPGFVDVFIAVGELSLFALMFYGHRWWHRAGAWVITITGLAASVAANAGSVWPAGWATRVTYAVPPVAAAAALYVGLGLLKRIIAIARQGAAPPALTPVPAAADPAGSHSPADPAGRRAAGTGRPSGRAAAPRPAAPAGSVRALQDAAAMAAIRAAVAAGGPPPSARSVAVDHLGGAGARNRAQRLIAAAQAEPPAAPPAGIGLLGDEPFRAGLAAAGNGRHAEVPW